MSTWYRLDSSVLLSMPLPMVALPCGSRSTSSTRCLCVWASRKVDGGGGLADAALLVGDAEHAGGLAGRYVFHMFP